MLLMKEKKVRENLIKDLGIIRTKSRIFQVAYRIGAIEKQEFVDRYGNLIKKIFIDYEKIKDYYQKRINDNKIIDKNNNKDYLSVASISKKFSIRKDVVYYLINKFKSKSIKKDNYYDRILINEQEFKEFYSKYKKNLYKRKYED